MQITVLLLLIALWLGQSQGHGVHKPKDHIPELKQVQKQMQPHLDSCRKAFPANNAIGNEPADNAEKKDPADISNEEKEACERVQKINQTIDTIISYLKADQPSEEKTAELNNKIREIFNESIDKFVEIIKSTRAELNGLAPGIGESLVWKYERIEMNDEKAQSLQEEMKILAKQLENKNLHHTNAEREARNYEILLILMKLHLHSMGSLYADTEGACPMQKQPPSCRIQNQKQPQPQEQKRNQALNFADLVTRKKRGNDDSDELQPPQPGCYGCMLELWDFTKGIFAMLASFWEVPRFFAGLITAAGYVVLQVFGCACLSTFGLMCCLTQPSLMKSFCFCKDTPGNNVRKWRRAKEKNAEDYQNQSCCGCWSNFGQGLSRWYHIGNDFKRKKKVAVGVPVPNVQQPIPPHQGQPGQFGQQSPYGQPAYPPQAHQGPYGQPAYPHGKGGGYPGGPSGR